ncbi:hypothetical protein [Natronogracilivirga saccharolytica]|uniref:Uncharacterized protein n=1 Tax=Natronogracilivirga saccharolytica TaxID=2812953 RepID=A0A8J7RKP0_9BACT|nr:hypothetical protein [Natronogracilivirga saccharolytica]MBP3191913.1 hypothetical protein [Natronogracilivirga saccharolytica]
MSTSQTLLSVGAVILLSIVSLSIGRMYVQSVHNSVDHQHTNDALNLGRDLSEEIQSYAFKYDELEADFGDLSDVTNPARRRTFPSEAGELFYVTYELEADEELVHGQGGHIVTIRIFMEQKSQYTKKAEYVTAVLPM